MLGSNCELEEERESGWKKKNKQIGFSPTPSHLPGWRRVCIVGGYIVAFRKKPDSPALSEAKFHALLFQGFQNSLQLSSLEAAEVLHPSLACLPVCLFNLCSHLRLCSPVCPQAASLLEDSALTWKSVTRMNETQRMKRQRVEVKGEWGRQILGQGEGSGSDRCTGCYFSATGTFRRLLAKISTNAILMPLEGQSKVGV